MTLDVIYENTPYYPAFAALEVTLRCNLKCIHCGSSATIKSRKNELSFDEWKQVVNELHALNIGCIVISGGEPFVYEHLVELCKYISGKNVMFSIISNGYNVKESDIKKLLDLNISVIGVSIDGCKDTHNKIRGRKDAFDNVTNTLKLIKKNGGKTSVVTSVNKLNFSEIDSLFDYFEKINIDIWQVQAVNTFGRAGEGHLQLSQEQYAALVEKIREIQIDCKKNNKNIKVIASDSMGYCYGAANDIWGDQEWNGCNAGRYILGIRSNGDITGCLSLQNNSFIIGNTRSRNIVDLWKEVYVKNVRTDQSAEVAARRWLSL